MTGAMHQQTAAIVGLGLMGGSMALALRPRVARVIGIDPSAATLDYALKQGIIDTGTSNLQEGVREASMVILAAPVQIILDVVRNRIGSYLRSNTLLIDLGSTKVEICHAMGNLPISILAMGGHPMCGKERSGIQEADATLYKGCPFVLCAPRRATPAARQRAMELVNAIDAAPIEMEAERHDHLVAGISHLPYLLSSALVRTIAGEAQADPTIWELAASGFRDTSRLAGSDIRMMTDIISTNTTAVARLLALFRVQLATLEVALIAHDDRQLAEMLTTAHDARRAWEAEYLNKKREP
ncbi:MAG: prephenate dehydrogenase/arogenate dehydrogenase family protein [Anaerolineae bacterium]|nr:prephenate dehydrogenase/arogenate dehydrogenase family protein [Anaerolineae bacterium]